MATRTEALGINPVGTLQLGENTQALTYEIAFDDVSASSISGPTPTPTYTPTNTATSTPTATDTPTNTPTLTATATVTQTMTSTPTLTSTPTSTFTSTPSSSFLFSDAFETGDLSQWTTNSGLIVQNQQVANDSFATRGVGAGAGATYRGNDWRRHNPISTTASASM